MKTLLTVMLAGVVALAAAGAPRAWAASTVVLGRVDSTPRKLVIKPGDDVRFINGTGGRAELWFGGRNGLRLFVEPGGTLVKFDRAGTYDYSVDVSGTKASAHNGEVIVH